MDDYKNYTKIPVEFTKTEDDSDSRFTKVTIKLMHLGKNYNNSYFDKSTVEEALPTLANTPILGYIEVSKSGEDDFSDHRHKVEKKNGTYSYKYMCQAFGVIPENNMARFEDYTDDQGVTRTYVVVDGLLWNKWDNPIDIMNRDTKKSQSMELDENSYSGHFDSEGVFHFDSFRFFGATILGSDYQPAMADASIEVVKFSVNDIAEQIKTKLNEYYSLSSNKQNEPEGGNQKVEISAEKLAVLTKYNFTKEQLETQGVNIDELSVEDLETKTKSMFALMASQMAAELSARLNANSRKDSDGWVYKDYYYLDNDSEWVIAESRAEEWRAVGFKYSISGDVPVIDFESKTLMKKTWSPMVEGGSATTNFASTERLEYEVNVAKKQTETEVESKFSTQLEEANTKFTQLNEQFTALESEKNELANEITGLREFKLNKTTQERKEAVDELVTKFEQLTEDEVAEFKEKAYAGEIDLSQFEEKLFSLAGKKLIKFSANPKPKSNKIPVSTGTEEQMNPIDSIISKYIKVN